MSSLLIVLDRLLEQDTTSECEEHIIEQAHYAVDNVHQKFLGRFEMLVNEISNDLGQPEYNANTEAEGHKNPLPKWVTGSRKGEASNKVLRLSYWKRENGISYLILRLELDSKDRPKYYDLVLGARKRTRREPLKIDKLRSTDTRWLWLGWLKRWFSSSERE